MGKYFGTDGFRGEVNVDLTVEHAFKIGRFLGYYYSKDKKAKIVIGKDTRLSSYMLEYSLVAGLTASGADVYLLHVTTTPSVSYVVRTENFDCGIMISASHNPFYDNGIKLINSLGHKLENEVEDLIEKFIDHNTPDIPFANRDQIGKTTDYVIGRNRYLGYLISLATRSFKNLRVALDCGNGSSYSMAKSVFDALGAKTYVINNEPTGININLDCGSTHIDKLQNYVIENNLDVGFAYDGDADRCLAVDDKGHIIDGDMILYICGLYMKQHNELSNNTVVATVMSNMGLFKALEKKNIAYEITSVGDKNVFENMYENGHCLGGEQSGHIIFGKNAVTGDGILTSLKIMEVILESKCRLSDLVKDFVIYPQLLVNVKVIDKKAVMNDLNINNIINKVTEELGSEGRILVRESGTEPVIRVMVEGQNEDICKKYSDYVIENIEMSGYIS